MPKLLCARQALDAREERQVRKLATSTHAPADWIFHAQLIVRSWDGQRTSAIAEALGCHPQTVRERLHAFNERGLDGLGTRAGAGRKPRLSEAERSAIIALVHRLGAYSPTRQARAATRQWRRAGARRDQRTRMDPE